jgi:type I restriction enzyme S subunit
LKPKVPIVDEFYKYLFKSQEFIGRLAVAVIGIRDGKQISYSDFASMKLAYPSIDEQKCIGEALVTIDQQIESLKTYSDALQLQKKGLMQRLLTGQVRVQVDEE